MDACNNITRFNETTPAPTPETLAEWEREVEKQFPQRPEKERLFAAYQDQCKVARQWMEQAESARRFGVERNDLAAKFQSERDAAIAERDELKGILNELNHNYEVQSPMLRSDRAAAVSYVDRLISERDKLRELADGLAAFWNKYHCCYGRQVSAGHSFDCEVGKALAAYAALKKGQP